MKTVRGNRDVSLQGFLFLLLGVIFLFSATQQIHAQEASQEPEPIYVQLELNGEPVGGENCEGGDWQLHWRGAVAAEAGPLEDLLISYTAFDTSHQHQRPIAPISFRASPVNCRNSNGAVELQARVTPNPSRDLQFTLSLAQNPAMNSPGLVFGVQDIGSCHIQSPSLNYVHQPIMASINSAIYNPISPPLDITLEDLQKGFNKTFHFSGMVVGVAPLCMGAMLSQGSLQLRYKANEQDPRVTLDACLHLAKGERREVNALGSPEGGRYEFSAQPAALYRINAQGNSAAITGEQPGQGSLKVDYHYQGKTASAQVQGSVVELIAINGGQPLPKLGLFDVDGKAIQTLYSFPLQLNPADGLVQFTLEQDSLASVINSSSQVQIQPVKTGKTLLQAKTLCGTNIGEPVAVEIVRCGNEVEEQLRQQQTQTKQQLDHIVKRITGVTGESEFNRAADQIGDTTKDMAIKLGETIIGTLSFGEGEQIKFAAKNGIHLSQQVIVNAKQLEVAGTLWDSYNALGDARAAFDNPGDLNAQAKFAVGAAVLVAQKSAISLGKTYGEAYLAAQKFGQDLGILVGAAEQLANLEPQQDQLIKKYIAISDRLKFCAATPIQEPPAQIPPPTKPDTDEPPPEQIPETPEVDEPPVDQPSGEEPPIDEPPVEEPPIDEPPEQEIPPKSYGLACRIQDLKAPQLAFELRQLQLAVQQQAAKIQQAQAGLQIWQQQIETMRLANAGTDQARANAFNEFANAQQQFMLQTAEQGKAELGYLMDTEECPEKLEIKFDQIRAHYN